MDDEHRQIPFDEGRPKARQVRKACKRKTKRRSDKKDNYRKPPQSKKGPSTLEEVHEENSEDLADRSSPAKKTNKKAPTNTRKTKKGLVVPTTSEDGPEDNSEDLFTRRRLAKNKAPAKTRETRKGGWGGKSSYQKPTVKHSTAKVPDLLSVRVLRSKRVVISEEDEEDQDEGDGEEQDAVEDELECMEVDDDDMEL